MNLLTFCQFYYFGTKFEIKKTAIKKNGGVIKISINKKIKYR